MRVFLGRLLTLPFFWAPSNINRVLFCISDVWLDLEGLVSLLLCGWLSLLRSKHSFFYFLLFKPWKVKGVKRHERPPSRKSSAALCLNSSIVTVWQFLLAFTSVYYHSSTLKSTHWHDEVYKSNKKKILRYITAKICFSIFCTNTT